MAVDTRDKRGSVPGLGLAFLLVLPAPGTIDQPDRQHVAYSYRGLTANEPQELTPLALVGLYDATLVLEGYSDGTLVLVGRYMDALPVTGEV